MTTRKEQEERREHGRRAFIRWTLAVGAALAVPQWKILEVIGATGGKALADDAVCAVSNRSVHIVAGDGGFAWFQLLWPHNDVAAARNDGFAFHAPGESRMATGTHKPLTFAPETPFQTLPGAKQMTAFMSGNNETHTRTPSSSLTVATNVDLFGAAAAIQTANPSLVPVIAVGGAPFRNAPGAPRVARVGAANEIVRLFDSAASRAGGLLANSGDAELYASSYGAFAALRSASRLPTQRVPLATGASAARFLGRNLAGALTPTEADFTRYGISDGSRAQNRELARGLIIAAKAFSRGLTSSVILPAFQDDPHGAFNDMGNLRQTINDLGRTLDAFYADCMATDDPSCAGTKIGDNLVMSIHGDTPKNPLDRGGWPDGTPGNSNWTYVFGGGRLKTGWFGGIQRNGDVRGWNPTTGEDSDMSADQTAAAASAAILYAVSRGDLRRVQDFYRGADIRGVIASSTL